MASDWADEKARDLVIDVQNEFGLRAEQRLRLERTVAQALREARAEGMRNREKVADILKMIVNTEHFFEGDVRQWAREGLALLTGEDSNAT